MKFKSCPKTALILVFFVQCCIVNQISAQDCSGLTATFTTGESRCTATGTLQIHASGGSGTYNYRVNGTTSSDFTSSSSISGLPPGTYSVTVKDIVSGCTYETDHIIIGGSYSDPRFGITETDPTCENGNDGSISVTSQLNGRGPFTFTLVDPSPAGIGTSNSTGTFTGLIPGSYAVEMTDSCGALQTRNITIQHYTWSILSAVVSPISCGSFQAGITLRDSKGNTNASGSTFAGYQYGVVNNPGDTSWFNTQSFVFDPGHKWTVALAVKDRCGNIQYKNWANTAIPSVAADATLSSPTCTGFNAVITGQKNLTNPNYCIFDNSGHPVSGQPCNSTGSFSNLPYGSYCIKVTNTCFDTVISRCFTQARAVPAITGNVAVSNYTCTTVTATVTGQKNLTNPQYCLYDNSGNAVGACNTNGIFYQVPYGLYFVKVTDGCTGTLFTINFNAAKRTRSVASAVSKSGYTCTSFTATVTGASNLVSPQYCLLDGWGSPITCNSTGIFPALAYGSYCVNITDACGDTSIQRCFTGIRPPASNGQPAITNKTCTGFTVNVTGEAGIYNGKYCLLDAAHNPIAAIPCNSTGKFTNIPYGSYCIQTTDGCSGAVLYNCFIATPPVPAVGAVTASNRTCSGFTATVNGKQNLTNPQFCLFDKLNNPIGSCNSTGVFNVTGFGDYYIKTTDGCAGAVFTSNFSVRKPIASVGSGVNFTNQDCTTFSASINGQLYLIGATYFLKNNSGNIISTNSTGAFDHLPYGSYCIDIQSSCMDTTIERCFSAAASVTAMTVTVTPSCVYNASDLNITVNSGYPPYVVNVYDTLDRLIKSVSSSASHIAISQIPALIPGQKYKVQITGACGAPATQYVLATESRLTHDYTITPKCPSSIAPNGSSDLLVAAGTNLSGVNLSITQKDFTPVSLNYSSRSGNNFIFNNLDNAVYVITYSFPGCSTTINDTVTLSHYTFPNLARSAAYQCDNNSFSVGASVSGGAAPFTYQVIGSAPSAPSIISSPQSDPVFTISNGVQYSLIRLRAIDACGNGGLNDVSILPLANSRVSATSNCIYQDIVLSTNALPNATYNWYKKDKEESTDSILVGYGPAYHIPFLTPADTGIYVSRLSVNSGCLTKLSYFHLDGMCGGLWVLPQAIVLHGRSIDESANQLSWSGAGEVNNITFRIERKNESETHFSDIGMVPGNPAGDSYNFIDRNPGNGNNFYRLKIIGINNRFTYSNTVQIRQNPRDGISVYPNPATRLLNINIRGSRLQRYQMILYNIAGQVLYSSQPADIQNSTLTYYRDASLTPGVYLMKVKNLTTGESTVFRVLFGGRGG